MVVDNGFLAAGSAHPLADRGKEYTEKRTAEPQNIECRMSKEGILSVFIDLKGRAQRFHPSKFCGSIFEILRFAV